MTAELIDIYDEKMNLLGTATREQAHREGLWHTSFHCWLVRLSQDNRPQVLLQNPWQNSKPPFPDRYIFCRTLVCRRNFPRRN